MLPVAPGLTNRNLLVQKGSLLGARTLLVAHGLPTRNTTSSKELGTTGNKKLLAAIGIATRMLLVAPGLTAKNKKL